MMYTPLVVVLLLAKHATAFPWVSNVQGVDSSLFRRNYLDRRTPGDAASCPYNPNHQYAVPINDRYNYCGAIGGLPGRQTCVNNLVPAAGDTAHYFTPPGPNDIRGPCPGLNTAANHNV